MSKPLALLFAVIGVLIMFAIGAALSYRMPWLALLLLVIYICVIGSGFVLKAKLRKKS